MSSESTTLSAENLLAYEPFVRAVARGLLSDEHAVQDVVQETWVRALESPPQKRASLKSWLASVTRNLARNKHRGEGHRIAREIDAARPEEENVEASFEKLEAHRKVVDGVLALEEPYKTVVILAYYQDLSPARIAERLNRNPATVRSQLHRAHEILRVEMDAEFGGDRGVWAGLLLPMAGLQIGGASGSGAPQVASAQAVQSGPSAGFGGVLVKLAVVAGVVAAAVFVPPLFEPNGPGDVELALSGPGQGDERGGAELLLGQASEEADREAPSGATANGAASEGEGNGELAADQALQAAGSADSSTGDRQVVSAKTNLTIRCLDGNEPVEGVDVWMLDKRTLDEDPEFAKFLSLIEKELGPGATINWEAKIYGEWAVHLITDALGEAHFARSGAMGSVLASSATHKGTLDLTGDSAGIIDLPMELVSEVAVEVRDQSGEPVLGAGVSVRSRLTEIMSGDVGHRVTEAPNGRTVFRDFVNRAKFPEPGEPTFSVALEIPGMPQQRTTVDPFRGKEDPIRFEIGPTGPLEVRAVDAKGELIRIDGTVQIGERGGLGNTHMASSRAPLKDGIAHFEHVALNTSVEVRLSSPDMGVRWSAIGQGPSQVGVVATIRVVAPGQPEITGRILDESGAPLTKTRLHFTVCSQKPSVLQAAMIRTDDNGRFRVEVDESVPANTPVRLRFARYRDGYDGRVDIPLDSLSQLQGFDVGDIVLREIEGWIRGQVVDSSGEPIVGLQVSIKHDDWQDGSMAKTDEEGRFEMTALWPKQPKLSFQSSVWAVPQDLVLLPSADEHVIALHEGGRVAGRVLTDGTIDATRITMVLTDSDGGEEVDRSRGIYGGPKNASGEFKLGGLAPANYDLKLWYGGDLLLTLERIRVEAGQPSVDARLPALDLRGLLEELVLEVFDEEGAPIRNSVMARVFADGRRIGSTSSVTGKLSILFPHHPDAQVLVSRLGFIPVLIPADTADKKVVLRKGLSVTLHTLQRPAAEQAGKMVSLSLQRAGDPRLGDVTHHAWVPRELLTKGSARVVFPGPGHYELFVAVQNKSRGNGAIQLASVPEKAASAHSIEVRESDAGGTLDIALPKSFFE